MKRIRTPIEDMVQNSNQGSENATGVRCSKCHCVQFRAPGAIRNTRPMKDGSIKRYRKCRNCGHVWVTYER